MEIRKITVKNIKGFSTPDNIIEAQIKPRRYNLLVAPNGYGKSSLACAFSSLKRGSISVEKEDKFLQDKNLDCSLKLELDDGSILCADNDQNTISQNFNVYVINKLVTVRATAPKIHGYQVPHGEIVVPPVVIDKSIPPQINLGYEVRKMSQCIAPNGKLMPNLSKLFAERSFILAIGNILSIFDKYEDESNRRSKLLENVINDIKAIPSTQTATTTNDTFSAPSLDKVFSEPLFCEFIKSLSSFFSTYSRLQQFLAFYEIVELYRIDKDKIKGKCERAEYERNKEKFNKTLLSLNTTSRKLCAVEQNNQLVLKFPKAKTISNGQRDLLSFYARLFYFKSVLKKDKKYILIIDEVFDYLDDANFIAAQYYLSDIVNTHGVDVYAVVLTHLSPRYFQSSIFSPKKLNIQFLDKKVTFNSSKLITLISARTGLVNKDLQDAISSFLFHFNPREEELKNEMQREGLDINAITYTSTKDIRTYVFNQLDCYQKNNHYDCLAVALAVRIKIEEYFYNKILCEEEQKTFIETHTTKKKLDYVEDKLNIEVEDKYRLLSPIYNHLHDTSDFYRIASSLMNKVVQKLIQEVVEK